MTRSSIAAVVLLAATLLLPTACGGGGGGGGGGKKRFDVSITAFSHTTTPGLVSYSVDVTNLQGRDVPPFDVHVYLDPGAEPTKGTLGDSVRTVPGLLPNETRTVSFGPISQIPGDFESWALIDPLQALRDGDETNDVAGPESVTVEPQEPDLTVQSFTTSLTGLDVEYTIVIENIGELNGGSFWLDLYFDEPSRPSPNQPGDVFLAFPNGLGAGGTAMLTFTRVDVAPGSYRSWVQVDSFQGVTERDEGNNFGGPLMVDVLAPPGPEIVVRSLAATAAGQDVTYDVVLENVGMAATGPFQVDLFVDRTTAPTTSDVGDDSQVVADLAPGATAPLTFTQLALPTGSYLSWVLADSLDAVAEAIESNNVGGPEVAEAGPELEIVIFRTDIVGPDARYTVVVRNPGSADAGPFEVHAYFDRLVMPGPLDLGDAFDAQPGLPAGQETTVVIVEPGATGGHDSWMQVDATGLVPEIDESDNVAGPFFFDPGSALAPDIEVIGVTPTVSGSDVVYDIEVRNNGGSDAVNFFVDLYLDRQVYPKVRDFASTAMEAIPLLGPGATATVQVAIRADPGTYASWVQLDTDETVSESNEGNNVSGPHAVVVP